MRIIHVGQERRGSVKAIVYHRYGRPLDVLRVEEVEKPVPGPGEALIRVKAAAANALDIHFMRGKPRIARLMMGLRHPKRERPGVDVAGIVETVGEGMTLKPGDSVFGICRGAFAEFACIGEDRLAMKPDALSFEEAAALPVAGLTALQGLRDKGHLERGETLLVNGAGGGIGSFAIQIARALGAEVTAVCSRGKSNLVRSLGADRVLDYAEEDFTAGPERYDMIFDVASPHGFARNRRALRRGGRIVCAGMTAGGGEPSLRFMLRHFGRLIWGMGVSQFSPEKLVTFVANGKSDDLATLADWAANGTIRPIVDVRHGLEQVPQALADLAAGHATGKIVVSLAG
jgi:NADPH:quinone reductase-like Zn-dependent oxidoreductase